MAIMCGGTGSKTAIRLGLKSFPPCSSPVALSRQCAAAAPTKLLHIQVCPAPFLEILIHQVQGGFWQILFLKILQMLLMENISIKVTVLCNNPLKKDNTFYFGLTSAQHSPSYMPSNCLLNEYVTFIASLFVPVYLYGDTNDTAFA